MLYYFCLDIKDGGNGLYDFEGALARISSALSLPTAPISTENLVVAIARERDLLPPENPLLFSAVQSIDDITRHDSYSNSLLRRFPRTNSDRELIAVTVSADGNCLFHSASVLISGKYCKPKYCYKEVH